MSLYDDDDTVTDKTAASGWASGIKMMQSQLAFKKATITAVSILIILFLVLFIFQILFIFKNWFPSILMQCNLFLAQKGNDEEKRSR